MAIKNEIALILEQSRGTAVSGQELADRLGVSRAAVWKAVKQLQDEGYSISAGTNRGYMLESGSDVLTGSVPQRKLHEYRGKSGGAARNATRNAHRRKRADRRTRQVREAVLFPGEHGTLHERAAKATEAAFRLHGDNDGGGVRHY